MARLDDPPRGQHHEAAHVIAAFHDRQDQRERGLAVPGEATGVAAVDPDPFQPVVHGGDLPEQHLGGDAVAGVRGGTVLSSDHVVG
ncbi:hypothetical protein RM704_39115 [Streptomyces sp. DSM 3412]|uniref:Uncharacterized protein n=1 Tax=Streptomyces gottesmaniae TaxID=3075518 RepID=A0ABU2ZAS3_9ACTN|nr:hypothetical protein [Streptomyces sp. DSM 3412]MDT0573394.1 hypothetical protein [Streptomyces sp. DSM 3412]